jgi:hypothetical protein
VLIIGGGFAKRRGAIRGICSLVCVASVVCSQGELVKGTEIPGLHQDFIRNHSIRTLRNQGTTEKEGAESMIINFNQIVYNRTPMTRNQKDIKYIVIHDTGNTRAGANAQMHFQYFNSTNRNASADFFVDDKQILQINDWQKFYSWAVGDGRGIYGITNRNSISIELCINSDSNYQTAYNKTIELTRHLMNVLNVPAERVVRHYDASRKWCPGTMGANSWARWWHFKSQLNNQMGFGLGLGSVIPVDNEIVSLQKALLELGYKITVDGIIGPQTRGFLKDFQMTMSLEADGIYGPITKTKLAEVMSNEKMVIIYRSVYILTQTKKEGQDPLIFDRQGWMRKAANDTGVYWLIRKVADYVR